MGQNPGRGMVKLETCDQAVTDIDNVVAAVRLHSPSDEFQNHRILVIDDNRSIHDDFRKILGSKPVSSASLDTKEALLFGSTSTQFTTDSYEIDSAYQGAEGLSMIQEARDEGRDYSVAFVDVRMPPGLDGIETVERATRIDPDLQIVICTAYSDYTTEQIVGRIGTTDRLLFLRKPFDAIAAQFLTIALTEKWRFSRQIASLVKTQQNCISNLDRVVDIVELEKQKLDDSNFELTAHSDQLSRCLQERTVEILGTRDVAVFALAQLAESRDPETGEHLVRMRNYAQILAEHLSHDSPYARDIDAKFLEDLFRSTPLHDIGKVGIPDNILLKPGPLTHDEFEIMKQHTEIGAIALERAVSKTPFGSFLCMAADIARHHHERADGKGYPLGLMGQQIPLPARLAAVADVFDALTSKRVYKDEIAVDQARSMIEEQSGTQFDAIIVGAFRECFDDLVRAKAASDGAASKESENLSHNV